MNLQDQLQWIFDSVTFIGPELILLSGILILLVSGLVLKKETTLLFHIIAFLTLTTSTIIVAIDWPENPIRLFNGMIRFDDFSCYLKILIDLGGLLTILVTRHKVQKKKAEYFLLLITIVLGAHWLVMSMNFVMVLLSLELISLSSYALVGFNFDKKGAEGSLKYFLFGSVATATMIFGMSLLYGMSGTLDFSTNKFVSALLGQKSSLVLIGGLLTLSGFLFKIVAAPLHLWAADVYESAPTPVVAFLSVVPKLAGFGVLIKFTLAINLFGQSPYHWQIIIGTISMLSLTIGNFSALWQNNPKRMMAYSSIAQSGFLLVGLTCLSISGIHAILFYASIYLLMNFLTFLIIQQFEIDHNSTSIPSFAGLGRKFPFQSIAIGIGLISLVGFPLTSGFTAKFFIFSSLWEAFSQSGKPILIVLFVFGLANMVVSLFYYLKMPYFLFMKEPPAEKTIPTYIPLGENLLAAFLVVLLLVLFFQPGLLMGWINRINFVL
jgi:NADH-quinone oxidoreductase subunit N